MDVLRGRGHLWNKRASLFLSFFLLWMVGCYCNPGNKQTIFKASGHPMHLLTPGFLALEDLVSRASLCSLSPNKISCTSVMFFFILFCFVCLCVFRKRSNVVRLRGLPFSASESDIADFFKGLELGPDGVVVCVNFQGMSLLFTRKSLSSGFP